MNDPKTDLQTLLTTYFTVANITSITVIPNVKRGRLYDTIPESYIAVLSQTPRYDKRSDNEDQFFTLVCEYQINLADSSTEAVMQTCVDEVIDEIKSNVNVYNQTPARTHDFEFFPMPNFLNQNDWIIPMTFEVKYWAVDNTT